jgi:hypothetical protein
MITTPILKAIGNAYSPIIPTMPSCEGYMKMGVASDLGGDWTNLEISSCVRGIAEQEEDL